MAQIKKKKKTVSKKSARKASVSRKASVKKVAKKKPVKKKVTAKKATKKKAVVKKQSKKNTVKQKTTNKKPVKKKTVKKKVVKKKPVKKKAVVKKAVKKKPANKEVVVKKPTKKKPVSKKASEKKTVSKIKIIQKLTKKKKISEPDIVPQTATEATGDFGYSPYHIEKNEEYMNDTQKEHFRKILEHWRSQLMEEVDSTVIHMKEDANSYPDPLDRASQEEGFNLELRTRDRERKLIKKIEQSLDDIESGDYGYCESCGTEIGIRRLEARPTADKCIDCKTFEEIREKQEGA